MVYLILNKENKVLEEKKTLEEAKKYIKARPYLKYEEFEYEEPNEHILIKEI
jgi:hypothetical protein